MTAAERDKLLSASEIWVLAFGSSHVEALGWACYSFATPLDVYN